MSTTYPSITVDPGGTAKFPLQVTSPVVERVDLTVTGAPEGYTTTLKGGGLIVGSVTTTGTSVSPALELDVKVPDGTAPGTEQLTVLANARQRAGRARRRRRRRGHLGRRGHADQRLPGPARIGVTDLLVRPEADQRHGAGADVRARGHRARTAGTSPSSPAPRHTRPRPWSGAGDTENIKATVKPAFDAVAGQYLIDVTATAGRLQRPDAAGRRDHRQLLPAADHGRPAAVNTSVTAGSSSAFQVQVQNTGSADLDERRR